MVSPRFAVIGAGNVGMTMAGHLAVQGYSVNLYNRSEYKLQKILNCGGIHLNGALDGFGKLSVVSSNIKKVVENTDVIMVTTPAYSHKYISKLIAPYLVDGQIIILNPGRTFGSLEFTQNLKICGSKPDVIVGETQTVIYTTRSFEENVDVFGVKKRVAIGSFPGTEITKIMDVMKDVYPQLYPVKSTLEIGLNNIGAIFHPAPTILNTGWIESPKTAFKYYYEAITPTIAKFLEKMDKERIEVEKVLGITPFSAKDWLHEVYGIRGKSLYEAIQRNKKYESIDAPNNIKNRYICEDVPTGLVPIASMGEKLGIKTPSIDLVINLASDLLEVDFWKIGRTLENLGIDSLTPEMLIEYFEHGAYK